MKKKSFLNPPPVFIEIGPDSLKAVRENDEVELSLTRAADGRLTASCKEKIIAELKVFLKAKSWQPRARAVCALGARGVSMRRLSLPAGRKEEFHQRLLLQIEAEFPLAPDELAWGCQPLSANGSVGKQELLVAAVKKEVVADYLEIFRAVGAEPVFTLAALARKNLFAATDSFVMLHIGNGQSELTFFERGIPVNSRIVFSGGENNSNPPDAAVGALAQTIKGSLAATTVFISGSPISENFVTRLANFLGNGWRCERLSSADNVVNSAAIAGLQKISAPGTEPALILRVRQITGTPTSFVSADLKKWAVLAGALILAWGLLPFAEALMLKPHLAKKVAAFKADAVRLTMIDRELDFLRTLKQSQPPYLELLTIFSKAVPPGTHFEALSLNSHGEVSLRCAFRDGQQVADFRSKLIESGFFANVTVEEQTPTPDRQRVSVRLTAQEKPLAQLQALAAGLPPDDLPKDGEPSAPIARKETK